MVKVYEMNEILDADYDNVVLRIFKGKRLDQCPDHGFVDKILCINNGTAGEGQFVCWECFNELIHKSCFVFNKFKPVGE